MVIVLPEFSSEEEEEEDDEDGSSEEFTDSIEEEDNSLNSIQVKAQFHSFKKKKNKFAFSPQRAGDEKSLSLFTQRFTSNLRASLPLLRKYNSLIQAQARELSHLRQRMREGQGEDFMFMVSYSLSNCLQAFEELLRANDVDYYMGQSFREQLAQSSALAQRVLTKISGRKKNLSVRYSSRGTIFTFIPCSFCSFNVPDFFSCRLSKELQQKDKLIESLHTKLHQRPETPSSCHALSETTDQSDRTSMVSDEYQSNEDSELCSDMAATEFPEEQRLRQQGHASQPDGILKLLN
uniref:Olduvai domain-containing protein n=1 Tax=Xiphophorus maculatus TaxID=8083 RepID=A0A3B5Q5E2_XIPMA